MAKCKISKLVITHLNNTYTQEIKICYPSELFEEVFRQEIPDCILNNGWKNS